MKFYEKVKILKNHYFLKIYPLCALFTLYVLFCKKYINYKYFYSFMLLIVRASSTLPLFKQHFVKIVNFCPNSSNLADYSNFQQKKFLKFFLFLKFPDVALSQFEFFRIVLVSKDKEKYLIFSLMSFSSYDTI